MKCFSFALLSTVILFYSCSNDIAEQKEKELRSQIDQLKIELDDCKNGEDKLIGIIRNSYSDKDYAKAASTYSQLINKYPGTKYKAEALEISTKSNDEIEKQNAELEKQKEAEATKKRASLTKLKKEYDDIRDITWYYQRYFTHYTNVNRTSLYIGHTKGLSPSIRLKMSYMGDDWIFFENAYLSYDGNTKEIFFDRYKERKSDNGDGDVWEWLDVSINDNDIAWFKSFAASPNAKMRLTGKYTNTRTLTSQERQGILDIIAGYEYLKENIN